MADSTVTMGADLSALRRELGQIPNLTDANAQKMLAKLERAVRSAEKAAKASTKAGPTLRMPGDAHVRRAAHTRGGCQRAPTGLFRRRCWWAPQRAAPLQLEARPQHAAPWACC